MARGRMLSKSLSTSQRFASLFRHVPDLAEFAQSLYPLLVAHSDDFGRQAGDLFTVKHQVHPASPRTAQDFERALDSLAAVGLIAWYADKRGRDIIQIVDFDDHQTGLHKRTNSRFQKPPGTSGNFRERPNDSGAGNFREAPGDSLPTELNRTERKRTEEDPEDQEPRAGARRAHDFHTIVELQRHLQAAVHAELEADPSLTESELADRVKQAGAACRLVGHTSRQIQQIVEQVIKTREARARRFA